MKRLACLILITALALYAQGKKKKKQVADNPEGPQIVNLGEAKLAGEIPGERVSEPEKQSDWPAIATASDGSLYAIYVVWNDKDADSIVVRRKDPGGKSSSDSRQGRSGDFVNAIDGLEIDHGAAGSRSWTADRA